jgi:hypothetical protein
MAEAKKTSITQMQDLIVAEREAAVDAAMVDAEIWAKTVFADPRRLKIPPALIGVCLTTSQAERVLLEDYITRTQYDMPPPTKDGEAFVISIDNVLMWFDTTVKRWRPFDSWIAGDVLFTKNIVEGTTSVDLKF